MRYIPFFFAMLKVDNDLLFETVIVFDNIEIEL